MAAERVTATSWLSPGEQHTWRAWLDVTRMLNERLGRQLAAESALSLAEYEILVQLSEHPAREMRMSELADRAVNSRSRLTHTVARMEERGLVLRVPCPDDGRGVMCSLTEVGMQAIVDAAPGHVEAVRQSFFDPLDTAGVAALGQALDRIRDELRGG